jgi:hypothetical protein
MDGWAIKILFTNFSGLYEVRISDIEIEVRGEIVKLEPGFSCIWEASLVNCLINLYGFIDSFLQEQIVNKHKFVTEVMSSLLNQVMNEILVLLLKLDVQYATTILGQLMHSL